MEHQVFIPFITFFIWMILLILLSFFVDYLLARIFSKGAHRFFVFLGVIVHEYSHAFGCLITRTKIKEIKLFEESGGHVTHEKRNPFVTAIIGMMPLFGCSLFILLLAIIFWYIGVWFPRDAVFSLGNTNFLNSFGQFLVLSGNTYCTKRRRSETLCSWYANYIHSWHAHNLHPPIRIYSGRRGSI